MFKLLEKHKLNESVTSLKFEAPFIAKKVCPGQFVILRIDETGERIPLTVSDFDRTAGTITLVVQAIGFTTKKLCSLNSGDCVLDIVGPLGLPTEFGDPKKAIVIGGGVGCAIAYPQAKALYSKGVDVTVIAGFRSKDIVILEDEMKAVSNHCLIMTDDGTYGRKGLVTEPLGELISKEKYDLVIAIGPVPMMKFVSLTTKPYGIKTLVSLNPVMIDGTGMCGGCRVTVGGETKFACVDGPDFDGHEVDFDEAMMRGSMYKDFELKKRDEMCNLLNKKEGN